VFECERMCVRVCEVCGRVYVRECMCVRHHVHFSTSANHYRCEHGDLRDVNLSEGAQQTKSECGEAAGTQQVTESKLDKAIAQHYP